MISYHRFSFQQNLHHLKVGKKKGRCYTFQQRDYCVFFSLSLNLFMAKSTEQNGEGKTRYRFSLLLLHKSK
jgi:hypothetical protein